MNELQSLFHDTVTRLFTDLATQDLLERTEEGEWPGELWEAIEQGGLTRPNLPEDVGGAGGTWSDAYLIVRAAGRFCVPLPVAETLLAGWLLNRAGIEIPDGPLTVLPEVVEHAALEGGGLNHKTHRVPWGRNVAHAVFVTERDGTSRVGLLALDGADIAEGDNLAREPRDDIEFTNATPIALAEAELPPGAPALFGAMLRSAQMAGALESILAQAVQYAGERIQFGRPIAKFQAIQQDLARLAGQVAASTTAAQVAFRAADREGDFTFEVACAKVRVGDAVEESTSIAHQVHGAIGFTYEHKLHFATRRLWSWRAEYGTASEWAALLGRAAIARGADELWPYVTSR